MFRTFFAGVLVMSFLALSGGCLAPRYKALPPDKIAPRIAVTTFENRSGFRGKWELGRGMADLLISELVMTRRFEVLERDQLNYLLDEIEMQRNGFFRNEGRVPKGRLKNARYLIRGTVNDFCQVSGGSLWYRASKFLAGGSAFTARVSLTLTVIDVESGSIIDAVQCDGDARAKSAYAEGGYDDVRFGGDTFFRTPLGKATSQAISNGLKHIMKKMPPESWKPMVAGVAERQVIVNGGENRGVKVGAMYRACTAGEPVTDPQTGDVISVIPGKAVAVVRISRVSASASYGEVIQGGGVQRGQILQPIAETAKTTNNTK